ncbi:MAG: endo-1,4-beta-xylanase [Acidobacteriota bacterium]
MKRTLKILLPAATVVLFLAFAVVAGAKPPATLKDAFKGDFYIGAAINAPQIEGKDAIGDAIITSQFNTISPENALKWMSVHPQPGMYDFRLPDEYVAFGEAHHMYIHGHTLVWHNQTPAWVFQDEKKNPLTRDALLARLHDHIQTVVGRYKGRIQSWDVVNEALNEDGAMRQSEWYKIIGPDYIAKAFQYAHEADPQALLCYNDYNIENQAKRDGAVALVKKLKAEGVPIGCVGIQDHDHLDWPTPEQEDAAISAFAALGVKVAISELDVDVLPRAAAGNTADVSFHAAQDPKLNPYVNGLPDAVAKQLAARYADLFRVFAKHRGEIVRVTFWGVTNRETWLNNFPVRGRTNYPLLFDREGQPTPAFNAVVRVGEKAKH